MDRAMVYVWTAVGLAVCLFVPWVAAVKMTDPIPAWAGVALGVGMTAVIGSALYLAWSRTE